MTNHFIHTTESNNVSNLLRQVVLLLLGTPPTVGLVAAVAAVEASAFRITSKGGTTHGRA